MAKCHAGLAENRIYIFYELYLLTKLPAVFIKWPHPQSFFFLCAHVRNDYFLTVLVEILSLNTIHVYTACCPIGNWLQRQRLHNIINDAVLLIKLVISNARKLGINRTEKKRGWENMLYLVRGGGRWRISFSASTSAARDSFSCMYPASGRFSSLAVLMNCKNFLCVTLPVTFSALYLSCSSVSNVVICCLSGCIVRELMRNNSWKTGENTQWSRQVETSATETPVLAEPEITPKHLGKQAKPYLDDVLTVE